jgi:hypothetical protein
MKHLLTTILLMFSFAAFSQTVPVTNTATLDGSASNDVDGSIVKYLWVQTGGTAITTVNNADKPIANVVYTVAGTYNYSLTVTDDKGATGIANVQVIVQPADNVAPKAVISVSTITIKLPPKQ